MANVSSFSTRHDVLVVTKTKTYAGNVDLSQQFPAYVENISIDLIFGLSATIGEFLEDGWLRIWRLSFGEFTLDDMSATAATSTSTQQDFLFQLRGMKMSASADFEFEDMKIDLGAFVGFLGSITLSGMLLLLLFYSSSVPHRSK